jgi:glycerophosphoryl diester phosphodiesterase
MRATLTTVANLAIVASVACTVGACARATPRAVGARAAPPAQAPTLAALRSARLAVIAHRGFSARAPEHTLAAYDLALAAGADFIEQDLQQTADARLVVLHDETLDRTARGPSAACTGPVRAQPLAALAACDVSAWFTTRTGLDASPAGIPVLEDVLRRYAGRARFYIETKSPDEAPGMEDSLVAALGRAGLRGQVRDGRPAVVVQSFSAASLQRLAERAPEVPRVQLLDRGGLGDAPEAALDAIAAYAHGIGPSRHDVTPALVQAAHARCLVVHPYTVNDTHEMRRLAEAGVDGMFTDRPDALRTVARSATPAAFPARCYGPDAAARPSSPGIAAGR